MPDASPRRGLSRLPLGYLVACAVFVAALVVVQLYVHKTESRELEAAETAFAARTDEMAALLVQRLDNYELINRGVCPCSPRSTGPAASNGRITSRG